MKKMIISVLIFISTAGCATTKDICANKNIDWLKQHISVPKAVTEMESKRNINGMCEIIIDTGNHLIPVYAGEKYIITGAMFQNKIQRTKETLNIVKAEIAKNNIKELDTTVAFTYKPENSTGKHVYMVIDPLCPYSSLAAKRIKKIADETQTDIKVVLYALYGENSVEKAQKAICNNYSFEKYISTDWENEQTENVICDAADNRIKKAVIVSKRLGVSGVPSFVLEDGRVTGGDIDKLYGILVEQSK